MDNATGWMLLELLRRLKRRLKPKLAALAGRWKRNGGGRVVVLCYHSIHPSKPFASATPEEFEAHLRWLTEYCSLVPFSQVTEAAKAGDLRPVVAITFDDGYVDNYEYAFLLLQKYNVTATFFITAGLMSGDSNVRERFRRLRQASLDEVRPLTWDQLREMRRAGMQVGSHTWSHPNLARLGVEDTRHELRRSKEVLEDELGEAIKMLAYPFGKPGRHFSPATVDIARDVGYELGAAIIFRNVRPNDDPLALPRFFVTRDDLATLQAKVYGAWDFLGWWHEHSPSLFARLVSPEDFKP